MNRNEINTRRTIIVHIVLTVLVVGVMIAEILNRNFYNVFLCGLTILLFNIPRFAYRKFNIKLPSTLEIIILLFIFAAEIMGEIQSFYTIFPAWDSMLHTINGFLMAAIGFSLIDVLNNDPRFHISLSPVFVAFVAFCFSMTVGVVWEFFEFGMDSITHTDMQKDFIVTTVSSVALNPNGLNNPIRLDGITSTIINYISNGQPEQYIIQNGYLDIGIIDTMKDLIVNCIGAVVFSVIGFFYIKGRKNIASQFIPQLQTNEEMAAAEKELSDMKERVCEKRKKLK